MASRTISLDAPFSPRFLGFRRMEYFLCRLKFTPNGRYGISIFSGRTCGYDVIEQLIVYDVAQNKIVRYNFEGGKPFKWSIFFCVSDIELIVIHKDTTEKICRTIVRLDHNKETFMAKVTKDIICPRVRWYGLNLRFDDLACYGTTLKFENEDHIVCVSTYCFTFSCYTFFLIPKNPNSQTKMKLFVLNESAWERNDGHVAVEHHRIYSESGTGCVAEPRPLVINGSLCFPFLISREKVITGVWLKIDLDRLVNLLENEIRDLDHLRQLQEDAYSIISTPAKTSDIEMNWPLYESNFYTDGITYLQWRKNRIGPTPETEVPEGLLAVTNGKVKTSTFNAANNCKSFFTTHPFGLLLRWFNLTDNSVQLQITDLWNPSEMTTLSTLATKKVMLDNNQDLTILNTIWT